MRITKFALAAVLGMGSVAFADTSVDQQLQQMRSQLQAQSQQISAQQSEIAKLRADQGTSWLNAQRAEQVKSLVREVLSDADTRASLMDSAITAGHNGSNFFLASEDGNFLLNIDGTIQFRYIWNHIRDNGSRNDQEGFQMSRVRLGFWGNAYDPKLTYGLHIFTGDALTDGTVGLEDAWVAYQVADGWTVTAGQFQAPFLREEIVDYTQMVAVERSLTSDLFAVGYTQGVQVSYSADQFRAFAMVHDGSLQANTDYPHNGNGDRDVAIAARAEYLAMGNWNQFNDQQAWSGDPMGLLIGAAVDYENSEGEGFTRRDVLKWTVDASFEAPDTFGFSAFAAVIGSHPQAREAGENEPDQFGIVVQASGFVIPDKMDIFGRWEYIDLDNTPLTGGFGSLSSASDDPINILTFGTNYYFHKNGAKVSLDLVWVLDNTNAISTSTQQGLVGSSETDEVSVRAQFQLLF